jgi:hypothetical protein
MYLGLELERKGRLVDRVEGVLLIPNRRQDIRAITVVPYARLALVFTIDFEF